MNPKKYIPRCNPLEQLHIVQTKAYHPNASPSLSLPIRWKDKLTKNNIPLMIPSSPLVLSPAHEACVHMTHLEQIGLFSFQPETFYALSIPTGKHEPKKVKTMLQEISIDKTSSLILYLSTYDQDEQLSLHTLSQWREEFPQTPMAWGPSDDFYKIDYLADVGCNAFVFGYGLSQKMCMTEYGVYAPFAEILPRVKEKTIKHEMLLLVHCPLERFSDVPKLFALGADIVIIDTLSVTQLTHALLHNQSPAQEEFDYMVAEIAASTEGFFHSYLDKLLHVLQTVLVITDATTIANLNGKTIVQNFT